MKTFKAENHHVCINTPTKTVWPRIDCISFIFVLFHMLFLDLATSFEWGVVRKRGHLESIWKALNRHLSAIHTHTLFALSWDQKSNENITRKQIITEHQGGRSSGTAGPVVPESTSSSTKLGSPSIRCFEAKLKKPVPAKLDFLRFMQACKAKSCHPVVELPLVAHPPGHIIIYVWLEPFSLPAQ